MTFTSAFIEDKYIVNENGCWIWSGSCDTRGYAHFTYRGQVYRMHRISYLVHKGLIPEGMCVLHKCDCRPCVNPEHLFLGTYKDNAIDRDTKGRAASHVGEYNGRSILDENKVHQIKAKLLQGKTCAELAREYHVTWATIKFIKIGKTWRHVT